MAHLGHPGPPLGHAAWPLRAGQTRHYDAVHPPVAPSNRQEVAEEEEPPTTLSTPPTTSRRWSVWNLGMAGVHSTPVHSSEAHRLYKYCSRSLYPRSMLGGTKVSCSSSRRQEKAQGTIKYCLPTAHAREPHSVVVDVGPLQLRRHCFCVVGGFALPCSHQTAESGGTVELCFI